MRIGAMVGSFWRHQKLGIVKHGTDYLRKAREYGLDCYQMNIGRELASVEADEVARTKRVLDELEMTCCVGAGLIKAMADEGALRSIFSAARELEAHAITTSWSLGMRARHKQQLDASAIDQAIRRDIEATRKLAELAGEYDVNIAFENHIDYRIDEISRILDAVVHERVGLNFDFGNPLMYVEDPMEYMERFDDRILCTHAKDWYAIATDQGADLVMCELGGGLVEVPAILRGLRDAQRQPPIILEYWAQARDDVPYHTDAFWKYLGRKPEGAADVLDLLKIDAAAGHPAPLEDVDDAGLADEIRVMKATPNYVRAVLTS